MFSRKGNFKHVLQGSPSGAYDVAATPSNQNIRYIIPGKTEFFIYHSHGSVVSTHPTYDRGWVKNWPSKPRSVAVDSTGRIIVGFGWDDQKTVSIHQPDGTLISKFQAPSSPRKLTCTEYDKLIISFDDNTLQLMEQTGNNPSIIERPPNVEEDEWMPQYVCCSKQGELFVGSQGNPSAVFRYKFTNGEYKYLDCITAMDGSQGIALSTDETELFVVDSANDLVKVFRSRLR